MSGFNFNKTFVLKLSHLKKISFEKCRNITFDQDTLLELNTFEIKNCYIKEPKSLLKCPEVKEFFIENDYFGAIDLSSLHKLEYFIGHFKYFMPLEGTLLKKIELDNTTIKTYLKLPLEETEKEIFEKICSIKSLESIDFGKLIGKSLPKINMVNNSVSKIKIELNSNLNHLLKLFPNVTDLSIGIPLYNDKSELEIKESIQSKIKKFSVSLLVNGTIKFFCTSFKKLESVEIFLDYYRHIKLEKSFPIFNSNINIIFENLKFFHLTYEKHCTGDDINDNVIENIYNNINNMPNLEVFKINFKTEKINDGNFFEDFITKILRMKFIKKVEIDLIRNKNKVYTLEELEILFPDINFNAFYEVRIKKI